MMGRALFNLPSIIFFRYVNWIVKVANTVEITCHDHRSFPTNFDVFFHLGVMKKGPDHTGSILVTVDEFFFREFLVLDGNDVTSTTGKPDAMDLDGKLVRQACIGLDV